MSGVVSHGSVVTSPCSSEGSRCRPYNADVANVRTYTIGGFKTLWDGIPCWHEQEEAPRYSNGQVFQAVCAALVLARRRIYLRQVWVPVLPVASLAGGQRLLGVSALLPAYPRRASGAGPHSAGNARTHGRLMPKGLAAHGRVFENTSMRRISLRDCRVAVIDATVRTRWIVLIEV